MPFGTKVGSIKKLKESLKSSGQSFIKFIAPDTTLNVRFLEEPDKWLKYREVWSPIHNGFYPQPEEGMPGYEKDGVSTRYLANAIDLEDDKVIPLKLPTDLVNQLIVRFDKYDTIVDRDYELFRTGKGKTDTQYGLSPEPPTKMNLSKYEPLDLQQVLEDAYNAVWGGEDEDDAPKPSARRSAGAQRAKARAEVEEEPDDGDDGDDGDDDAGEDLAELAQLADDEDDADAQARLTELADELGIDVNDYGTWAEVVTEIEAADDNAEGDAEPEDPEDGEGDDSDDTYTVDELDAMTLAQLRVVARDNGLNTTGLSKPQIIAALSGEGGEEEPF